MAIIPQKSLFQWNEIESLGDLERLQLVLRHLPDEALMRHLERDRGKGRDDYPIRPMWNSLIAGVVFQHPSVEALRRELSRNAQLRYLCGFDLARGDRAVPPAYVYTRFLRLLFEHAAMIDAIFEELVERAREELPGFGEVLACDGKAIRTHANPRKEGEELPPDGRRDTDANWGRKTIKEEKEDGTAYERIKKWFGYKLHLIADATYELPVAFEVTPAADAEAPVGHQLIDHLETHHDALLGACREFAADKAYDDTKLHVRLWDDHQVKAVIPTRDMWKDGEPTRLVEGTRNVVYDHQGIVFCCAMDTGQFRRMAYGGFEADRLAHKYLCPARHYGIECSFTERCPIKKFVRVKLDVDRRIFTPLARASYAWDRAYKKRTAVERVNSRLDVSFGFERHFIRGRKKMRLRCGLALIVMLAMAVGRVKEKRKTSIRSLVAA